MLLYLSLPVIFNNPIFFFPLRRPSPRRPQTWTRADERTCWFKRRCYAEEQLSSPGPRRFQTAITPGMLVCLSGQVYAWDTRRCFFFFNFILYLLDLFVLAGHEGLRHLWYTQDMGFKWFAELFAIIFPLKLRWLLFKDASPVERITLKCDIEDTLHFTRCRWHSKKHYFKNGYKALIIISFVFRAA